MAILCRRYGLLGSHQIHQLRGYDALRVLCSCLVGCSGAAALRINPGADRLKLDSRRPKRGRGVDRGVKLLTTWHNLTGAIDDGLDRQSRCARWIS